MVIPELPLDVLVLIVEESIYDIFTLQALSLTCRSLRAVALPLISRTTISINLDQRARGLRQLKRLAKTDKLKHPILLLELTGDAWPHISEVGKSCDWKDTDVESDVESIPDHEEEAIDWDDYQRRFDEFERVEPYFGLVGDKCQHLQGIRWTGAVSNTQTMVSLAKIPSLKHILITFDYMPHWRGESGEFEILDFNSIPDRGDHRSCFENLTSLELYKIYGYPGHLPNQIVDIFFRNPGLKKLGLGRDLEYASALARDDYYLSPEDYGVSPDWFMDIVDATVERMEMTTDKDCLLPHLEELHLREGFALSDNGHMKLDRIFNLWRLTAFTYDNAYEYVTWEDVWDSDGRHKVQQAIIPENYNCLWEHAVNLEKVAFERFTDRVYGLLDGLPSVSKLKIKNPVEDQFQDGLEYLMNEGKISITGGAVWDPQEWYRNRKEEKKPKPKSPFESIAHAWSP